jgi:hypothetical protein
MSNGHLLSVPKENNLLWKNGIGGVLNLGLENGNWQINPNEIKVNYGNPKPLSTSAREGVNDRRKLWEEKRGPIVTCGNNNLTVTHTPYRNEQTGKIVLDRYLTDFASWMFTRPQEDEFSHLFTSPADVHYSFFISVIPVTSDGKVVIPNRGDRITYNNGSFVFTGGYGRDKDIPENLWKCESEMCLDGTGSGLLRQAMMIPIDQYGLGDVEKFDRHVSGGKLLGILNSDPAMGELGHHIAALVYLKDIDSKQVIVAANQKWGTSKPKARFNEFSEKNVFSYDPETLVSFANGEIGSNPLIKTQTPLVWLAVANEFGEKYLGKIKGLERKI